MHAFRKRKRGFRRTNEKKKEQQKKFWGFWWPKFLSLCGFIYCHIKCAYVHICLHSLAYAIQYSLSSLEMHKDTQKLRDNEYVNDLEIFVKIRCCCSFGAFTLEMQCNTQNNINERLNVYSHRYCARSCLMAKLDWDLNDKNHTDTERTIYEKKETKIPTHKCIYTKCVWVCVCMAFFPLVISAFIPWLVHFDT